MIKSREQPLPAFGLCNQPQVILVENTKAEALIVRKKDLL